MRNEFIDGIKNNQAEFGLKLADDAIEILADYFELVQEHTPILHLVGPSTPEEFAIRHILESLTLLEFLPLNTNFADVGTGAGLPSIPCLIVREDLKGVLIESKKKKTKFLELAADRLKLKNRVRILTRQFHESDPAECQIITCRALDKFTEKLARMLRWSMRRKLLLFGGPNLRDALETQKVRFEEKLMPLSEQRFLYILK